MGAARLFQCHCGITVIEANEVRYVWATGAVHSCEQEQLAWIDTLAEEALDGERHAAIMLANAVDEWVRR